MLSKLLALMRVSRSAADKLLKELLFPRAPWLLYTPCPGHTHHHYIPHGSGSRLSQIHTGYSLLADGRTHVQDTAERNI